MTDTLTGRKREVLRALDITDADIEEAAESEPQPPLEQARYVLVEKSRYDGSRWVTLHVDQDAASSYRDGQERPEDWIVEDLVDLLTAQRFYPIIQTTWEARP